MLQEPLAPPRPPTHLGLCHPPPPPSPRGPTAAPQTAPSAAHPHLAGAVGLWGAPRGCRGAVVASCPGASWWPWGASLWGASPWGVSPWGVSPWKVSPWGVSPWAFWSPWGAFQSLWGASPWASWGASPRRRSCPCPCPSWNHGLSLWVSWWVWVLCPSWVSWVPRAPSAAPGALWEPGGMQAAPRKVPPALPSASSSVHFSSPQLISRLPPPQLPLCHYPHPSALISVPLNPLPSISVPSFHCPHPSSLNAPQFLYSSFPHASAPTSILLQPIVTIPVPPIPVPPQRPTLHHPHPITPI